MGPVLFDVPAAKAWRCVDINELTLPLPPPRTKSNKSSAQHPRRRAASASSSSKFRRIRSLPEREFVPAFPTEQPDQRRRASSTVVCSRADDDDDDDASVGADQDTCLLCGRGVRRCSCWDS